MGKPILIIQEQERIHPRNHRCRFHMAEGGFPGRAQPGFRGAPEMVQTAWGGVGSEGAHGGTCSLGGRARARQRPQTSGSPHHHPACWRCHLPISQKSPRELPPSYSWRDARACPSDPTGAAGKSHKPAFAACPHPREGGITFVNPGSRREIWLHETEVARPVGGESNPSPASCRACGPTGPDLPTDAGYR